MQLTYSTKISLLFHIIPKHSDASFPSWWHMFKNCITVLLWYFHSQPFMNVFVTVESATSQMVHSSKIIHEDENIGEPSTSMTNVNTESVEKLI